MTSRFPNVRPNTLSLDNFEQLSNVPAPRRNSERVDTDETEVASAEPRIWKVLAIRRELRTGRYYVSAPELADALLGRRGVSSLGYSA